MATPATLSTVPAQTPYIQYVATSGQTVFPYPFEITQDSDLVVVANGVTLATDSGYTVSGVGASTGGNVTFTSGRAANDIITLFRDIPISRVSQIAQNSGFSSAVFNAEFNNIYLLLQQMQSGLDQCLQIPNTNNPAPTTTLLPANYANKYLSFDANGNPAPAALTSVGSLTQAIIAGLFQPQTGAEAAAGVTPVNFAYAPGDVRRYGPALDGVTDDTTPLANWLKVGGNLTAPVAATAIVSTSLALVSNTRLTAIAGFVIKQKSGAALAGGILTGSALANVLIEGLTIDGNAANNAATATYGIVLSNGSGNTIRKCYIHDTTQAGIEFMQEQNSRIIDNWLLNCGRNLGTDNHGIMVVSTTATALKNILIRGNIVDTAYRKGITSFSNTPGSVQNVTIDGNTCVNCGLGGVYVANAPGTAAQQNVCVTGNNCNGNATNIEFSDVQGGVLAGNTCAGGTQQSIACQDIAGATIGSNTVTNAATDAIFVTSSAITSTALNITGNTIYLPNQTSTGSGAAIHINGVTNSIVSGNTAVGESAAPKMVFGVLEDGASDHNIITGNQIINFSSSQTSITGANTLANTSTNRSAVTNGSLGVNVSSPNNNLDVSGGLSLRDQTIALVNGANNNVALPANAGTLYVSGPTAAYNITGIAGGVSGRKITLVNYTSQTMTVSYNNAGSTAANRILIGGSVDLAISPNGSVDLTYVAGASLWFVTAYKA